MDFYAVTNAAGMLGSIMQHIGMLEAIQQTQPMNWIADLPPNARQSLAQCTAFAVQEAKILGLNDTVQLADQFGRQLCDSSHRFSPELAHNELVRLKQLFVMGMAKRKFVYISPDQDRFFEQSQLFGSGVHDVFPESREDLKDAGNCLAASLPTASVFHLMRVAEHGLRKLAKKLRVKLTHTGKPCPLEFGDWDKVITAIRNKISSARSLPAGPKRQSKLEAYSSAADHCEYMKDIWRNNLAHTRKPYSTPEAIGVLERVRDFMKFLGKNLQTRKT